MSMKRFAIICIAVFFLVTFVSISAAENIQVVVSIPPQVYFVKQIGGDLVDVMSLVPAGANVHTYEPTASQMKVLSQANLYIRIRVEFEEAWWEKISAANSRMHVVDSTAGIELLAADAHQHEGEDEAHGNDPHIWLSPALVKKQAETICQGLIAVDPQHETTYMANKAAFLEHVEALDKDIQQILAGVLNRRFMVFHPSWGYFARDYHLAQIPIELEGKEPSAAEMVKLMKAAKQEQIRVIFVQPQASRRSADTIAKQIGATVAILDPLAENWAENLRQVAEMLAKTLKD